MNIHLRSLTWEGHDTCRASFATATDERVDVVFTLDRAPVGIGATPEPDLLKRADATAAEVRSLVAAVVDFCLTAQGESRRDG